MSTFQARSIVKPSLAAASVVLCSAIGSAQLTDITQTPNAANAGIKKSLTAQIGTGRGDPLTPGSSEFVIARDPFRAIARGRQIFQRKFTIAQGFGPRKNDGLGDIMTDGAFGAGLVDSCAGCHGRPFGSAGAGGNVFTRPDSRDAPHLFGLGLVEMLGDEITHDLRAIRSSAIAQATTQGHDVTLALSSKGISYGSITAHSDGSLDNSAVFGVDVDLRVKPFFAQGKTFSIRDFAVGALNAEMGLQSYDPDLLAASQGQSVTTPAGLVLDGSLDLIGAPPAANASDDPDHDGVANEIPTALVDYLEFYLLNYFPPALGEQNVTTRTGSKIFKSIGCAQCHVQDLTIDHDRRVASVDIRYDALRSNGALNHLYATATPIHGSVDDGSGFAPLQPPNGASFTVHNLFADFRRHDLGQNFYERNFDGSVQKLFMTEPLWGVGDTAPYGHDGRNPTLADVILRHGGEAQASHDAFANLSVNDREALLAFLRSLVLFGPPDTASNLLPANPSDPNFPLSGHGAIELSVLFDDPTDKE